MAGWFARLKRRLRALRARLERRFGAGFELEMARRSGHEMIFVLRKDGGAGEG